MSLLAGEIKSGKAKAQNTEKSSKPQRGKSSSNAKAKASLNVVPSPIKQVRDSIVVEF
jgi:hypothetical protein